MTYESRSDLLVVGAGPTGLAIGAEAKERGLDVMVLDRGPMCASILRFPRDMLFFTTRDKLEIAGVPFAIPDPKPDRRQALVYYQGVARRHELRIHTYEEVLRGVAAGDGFSVETVETRRSRGTGKLRRWAKAVVLATGYFDQPKTLGVSGEDHSWVHARYDEPFAHFREKVVVVGGGNSGCEAALDLWRNGAQVTIVHRRRELKPTVKYWLKPDIENRIEEGEIEALLETAVVGFEDDGVVVEQDGERRTVAADAVYVLIGYRPDVELERRFGVEVDSLTLVPRFDPVTCESNIAGVYLAGTIQAGRDTGKIFIENSRGHAPRIVDHLLASRLAK